MQSKLNTVEATISIDNGTTPYTKGTYKPLPAQMLRDSYYAVDGLVIDMKNGSIGFGKHSTPPSRTSGSS